MNGWVIWSPYDNAPIWHITFSRTRAGAIRNFCVNVDSKSYAEATAEAQSGRVWLSARLTPANRAVWRSYRAEGFKAVHAYLTVADCRVQQ